MVSRGARILFDEDEYSEYYMKMNIILNIFE